MTTTHALLNAPLLGLLLRLTAPNCVAFLIQAGVSLTEVWIVGQLGTASLAAIALVFPLLMLFQTVSGGAFGGAVGSAVARSLGSGDVARAEKLIWHAIFVAIVGAAVFFGLFVLGGRAFFILIGGQSEGEVLELAMQYSWVLFSGGLLIWLTGVLTAVFRGAGSMTIPAGIMTVSAVFQIPLTGGLVLGWFGLPALGMPGAAVSGIITASFGTAVLLFFLLSGRAPLKLSVARFGFERALLDDILKVARPATLNPIMTVSTILGLTALVSQFGENALAGYGIGARIEYIMLPVIFAFGTALTTIVGTNIGGGQVERAEAAGMYGVACSALLAGVVGITLALFPDFWIPVFTDDPQTYETAKNYMRIVGPAYPFLGGGLVLYFASQGAGAMKWPVSAMVVRFVLSMALASSAVFWLGLPVTGVFWSASFGMVVYASIIIIAVRNGAWRG